MGRVSGKHLGGVGWVSGSWGGAIKGGCLRKERRERGKGNGEGEREGEGLDRAGKGGEEEGEGTGKVGSGQWGPRRLLRFRWV